MKVSIVFLKNEETQHTCYLLSHLLMHFGGLLYIAINMDPDQTAHKGAVWSGFIVFASVMK